MSNNNIIPFPKENIRQRTEISEDSLNSNIIDVKLNHINEALVAILPSLFNNIDIAGFAPDEDIKENDSKDVNLIIESIRSLLCKQYGLMHPFQNMSEKLFIKDEDDDEFYKLTDKIEIVFDKDKIQEDINN